MKEGKTKIKQKLKNLKQKTKTIVFIVLLYSVSPFYIVPNNFIYKVR